MKMFKNSMKLLFIMTVMFGFVLYMAYAQQAHAGEHRKAPPSKPHIKKAETQKKERVHPADIAVVESARLVSCVKGQCHDLRTNELVGHGPDGSYLAYKDTQANRTKAFILGSPYVMFISAKPE